MATDTTLEERYRASINTSNLGSDPRTFRSPSDVVGAYGLADKRLTDGWVPTGPGQGYRIPEAPLAVPLERLFAGDRRAAHEIVRILAGMAWSKAKAQKMKPALGRAEAHDLACACLAWHMGGVCKACGGHGYETIPGTKTLSDRDCEACRGTGKIPFEDAIDPSKRNHALRELARWLVAEMTREAGNAGPRAMEAIAARMSL